MRGESHKSESISKQKLFEMFCNSFRAFICARGISDHALLKDNALYKKKKTNVLNTGKSDFGQTDASKFTRIICRCTRFVAFKYL